MKYKTLYKAMTRIIDAEDKLNKADSAYRAAVFGQGKWDEEANQLEIAKQEFNSLLEEKVK